jgi:hypothetical protein
MAVPSVAPNACVLMQHLANCLYNLRDGVFAVSLRRSAAWLGLVSILGSES